ncbi:hypothetical protein ACJX0J_015342, partial [Zea mays]
MKFGGFVDLPPGFVKNMFLRWKRPAILDLVHRTSTYQSVEWHLSLLLHDFIENMPEYEVHALGVNIFVIASLNPIFLFDQISVIVVFSHYLEIKPDFVPVVKYIYAHSILLA